jgi:hypothetical protein
MIKRYLPFIFQVFKVNIIISLVSGFISALLKQLPSDSPIQLDNFLNSIVISLLTGGFLLGIFVFELSRSREYYFYYNLGITKLKLVVAAYFFHLALSVPILFIAKYGS